MLVKTLLTEIN